MPLSALKHKIEMLSLEHQYALEVLKSKQKVELDALKNVCKHKYDDGQDATRAKGNQFHQYNVCEICLTQVYDSSPWGR